MPATDSTSPAVASKPAKPTKSYLLFPPTAHPVGQSSKKIRGKLD
jgi:hypothetical protein